MMIEPVDCMKTPYCYECNYRYQYHKSAWNDPNLSLSAKLLWTLITERNEPFDLQDSLHGLTIEDEIFFPLMELINEGYFDDYNFVDFNES